MFPKNLQNKLNQRIENNLLRQLKIYPKNAIDFFSNDYLGLSRLDYKPIKTEKSGATGSRLISGNSNEIEDLEIYLSSFYDSEAALLYHSGYDANLGFFSCVPQRHDLVIYDEYIHASIYDGLRLSHVKTLSFKHNRTDILRDILLHNQNKYETIFVIVEGIYSMDGDTPSSEEFKKLKTEFEFQLIVDEAHSTGILGKQQKGWYENLEKNLIFARIHTFGKALGTHGACVVGSLALKNYLINFSRPFIYTTGPSFSQIYEIHQHHLHFETLSLKNYIKLKENLQFFSNEMNLKKELISPIYSYFSENIRQLESALMNQNLLVKAIFEPTVPKGLERLRLSFHSFNTFGEISHLCKVLKNHQ